VLRDQRLDLQRAQIELLGHEVFLSVVAMSYNLALTIASREEIGLNFYE
jgi:hypothetical protein